MRVISGEAKGRRLKTPIGVRIRPTADRVKEALFSIIGETIRGTRVLDLFAGTGNLGIEALSRGARSALFVDKARGAVRIIEENLARTKLSQKGQIWCAQAHAAIGRMQKEEQPFDLVFLDPPYGFQQIEKTILALVQAGLLSPGSLVVVEHHRNDSIPKQIAELRKVDGRRFGDTEVTFFQQKAQA